MNLLHKIVCCDNTSHLSFLKYFIRLELRNITDTLLGRTFVMHFFFFKDLFIDWLLCWVFVSARELSLVAASGGHSSLRCAGLSLSRPLLLRSTGSRRAGSVVVAHGLCCSAACGILPDQGSNPCPLHWQADSQPLRYQGSPCYAFLFLMFTSLYCILINIISPTHKTPFSFT